VAGVLVNMEISNEFPISKSFTVRHYYLLYGLPITYIALLLYANTFERENLLWSDHRHILTVTSTFAYQQELRWYWLWVSLITAGLLWSNFQAIGLHYRYIITKLTANQPECIPRVNALQIGVVCVPLFLAAVVIFIQGTPPKKGGNDGITHLAWNVHYLFLLGLVASVLTSMLSIYSILRGTPNLSVKFHHHVWYKFWLTTTFIVSSFAMVSLGTVAIMTENDLFWDMLCIFEYTCILTIMLFIADVFGGIHSMENYVKDPANPRLSRWEGLSEDGVALKRMPGAEDSPVEGVRLLAPRRSITM